MARGGGEGLLGWPTESLRFFVTLCCIVSFVSLLARFLLLVLLQPSSVLFTFSWRLNDFCVGSGLKSLPSRCSPSFTLIQSLCSFSIRHGTHSRATTYIHTRNATARKTTKHEMAKRKKRETDKRRKQKKRVNK